MRVFGADYPQECHFKLRVSASREYGDLIGSNRFLWRTQTVFPRPSPHPHIACACVSRRKNGLVYETVASLGLFVMSILNYFKKASPPTIIDSKDKGDSDMEVPALTTSGTTQGAIKQQNGCDCLFIGINST